VEKSFREKSPFLFAENVTLNIRERDMKFGYGNKQNILAIAGQLLRTMGGL